MMAKRIPLLVPDLPNQSDLTNYLSLIDASRWYTNFGPLVKRFEAELAQEFALQSSNVTPWLTTVANGTLALELALTAMRLPTNATVLIPAFTFVATASAVVRAGYKPVIADIDVGSWLLTPAIALAAMKATRVDCVLPVAALGCPVPVDEWDDFHAQTGIPVLIDAAGAFGNQHIGKRTVVAFSLHATKALGIGEGGLVVSHDQSIIEKVRRLSNFGIDVNTGYAPEIGTNAKLSEYHAAVGLAALQRWPAQRARRLALHRQYVETLSRHHASIGFQIRPIEGIYTILQILLPLGVDRAKVQKKLAGNGIDTRTWYIPMVQESPAYQQMVCSTLENAQLLAPRMLGLPFHLDLIDTDIERVGETLVESLAQI
ncbi:MAG: DegT/DnrJ/EryC1/StrS family aminotransferase [Burkholderiales bacterium]